MTKLMVLNIAAAIIVCYYTIGGVRVLHPSRGIYIKVVRYKDGHTEQSKVCVNEKQINHAKEGKETE